MVEHVLYNVSFRTTAKAFGIILVFYLGILSHKIRAGLVEHS